MPLPKCLTKSWPIFALASMCVSPVSAAESAAPFDVGNRSQVFVDRALAASAEGVTFRLVPATKHPTGPWLDHNKDRVPPAGPLVLYDEQEKLFKSWSAASYNTSADGLQWSDKTSNPASWDAVRRASVVKDPHDPDAARRYKLLTFGPSGEVADANQGVRLASLPEEKLWYLLGYNTYVSPDGREVTHLSREPILTRPDGKIPGDMINAWYDRRHKLFVACLKNAGTGQEPKKYTNRRCFSIMTSPDFQTWSEPKLVFVPDEQDDAGIAARIDQVRPLLRLPTDLKSVAAHIYGVGGPIHLESCTLALLRVYMPHNKGDGPSEIQMAVSRDLEHWERPFREAFIPRGKVGKSHEDSDWDACWFNNEGPAVNVGDEVWVYYSARNTPHDHPIGFAVSQFSPEERAEARKHLGTKYRSGIGIAVWRRDRFASIDAGDQGGTLTTVPIRFHGSRLEVNGVTKSDGTIVAELLDADANLLARSEPFSGDEIRKVLDWEQTFDLKSAAARPIVLRFRLKNASLFAFAFR